MGVPFTPEQLKAIERRDGPLLVRAGAGTGKTSVLVERFVQAVIEDEVGVDAILAITFTDKAAAQLKTRVRERFRDLKRRDLARDAEAAWISTIHGFCSRVLRAHALAAGIDPEYRVLDELEAERLALEAFDGALEEFLADGSDPRRLEMAAAYKPDGLLDMVRTLYSRKRSRGERYPSLEEIEPPRSAGERDALERAAAVALSDLGAAPGGKRVNDAIAALERCGELLGNLADDEPGDPGAFEKVKLSGAAKALESAACVEYEEARAAWELHCKRHREYLDHTLLRVLLAMYGERYDRLKLARSGLDFEDLELIARDLLKGDPGLCEQYAGRFEHVMVDEFQDTNPLQNELLELIARDNLFRVGDERQSIYGFRHADIEVFRTHHEAAETNGRVEPLTVNFRSRGEVLDAIDFGFSGIWEDFEPLREHEHAREAAPRVSPPIDLLVTDRGRGAWKELLEAEPQLFGEGLTSDSLPAWRACEARLLAKRIDELTSKGGYEYGDVVLLLRATTHMSAYERALEERGVPTHVVGGRGYWSQQQVGDLRAYLGALANPRDELAVYSLLASPLVGASIDSVALAGLYAKRLSRDVWWALEQAFEGDGSDGLADALPAADSDRMRTFVRRFTAERRDAGQVSLETLIDRAVTDSGYDRKVLALPAGDRRMANVRKFMRMAREYEAEEGRNLRGFIDFVAERDLVQPREGEAPLEAAEVRAVRLMTIHRAKGLEFPVVCVGDLGKEGREDTGRLRITDDGRLGLRLASLSGGSVASADLEDIKQRQKELDEAEERRIFYVAMTRAQEHLVLSGATETVKEPEALTEPMRWVWRSFAPSLPGDVAEGETVGSYDNREIRIHFRHCTPATLDELLPPGDRSPLAPESKDVAAEVTPPLELGAVPAPRALAVSRLSYSGLEAYRRCGYRFYLEKALGLSGDDAGAGLPAGDELSPLLRGSIVHELLERLDFRRPTVPSAERVQETAAAVGGEMSDDDVADARDMVERFVESPLRGRLSGLGRVRSELPFAFTLAPPGSARTILVNGVVDVHAAEEDRTLIVDYKSDRLNGTDATELCDRAYSTQRLVYALAALRSGAERVEVVYCFLERPDEPVSRTFEAAEADELEQQLLELAAGVVQGRFEPTSAPHRALCASCPGQPSLCTWGPEHTLADDPAIPS